LIKLVVAKSKGSVGSEPKHYENDTPHTVALPASKTKPNEKLFNNNLNAKFFDQLGAE
jgi:hypothetical protein